MIFTYPSVAQYERAGVTTVTTQQAGPLRDNITDREACLGDGKRLDDNDYIAVTQGLGRYARTGVGLPLGWHYEHLKTIANMSKENLGEGDEVHMP